MTQRLKHAIIGCGRVAPNHAVALRLSGDAELTWGCDRDPAALETFSDEHRPLNRTLRVQDVLADPAVDSVSITVDHAQHAEIATAALNAGKHVLVEKPLALSMKDAQALIRLARQRNLRLMTVAQHRYDPIVVEVDRLLQAGAFGSLVAIWVTLVCGREPAYYGDSYWRGTWAGEGGSLLVNQAYHCLDLMVALGGGAEAQTCESAILKLSDVLETEDVLAATLRFPGGGIGTLSCTSATAEFWRSRIEIVGTDGGVSFDINHPARLHTVVVPEGVDTGPLHAAAAKAVEPAPGVAYYGASHNRQVADFLASVRMGRDGLAPPEAGLQTLDLILDLYGLAAPASASRRATVR